MVERGSKGRCAAEWLRAELQLGRPEREKGGGLPGVRGRVGRRELERGWVRPMPVGRWERPKRGMRGRIGRPG